MKSQQKTLYWHASYRTRIPMIVVYWKDLLCLESWHECCNDHTAVRYITERIGSSSPRHNLAEGESPLVLCGRAGLWSTVNKPFTTWGQWHTCFYIALPSNPFTLHYALRTHLGYSMLLCKTYYFPENLWVWLREPFMVHTRTCSFLL